MQPFPRHAAAALGLLAAVACRPAAAPERKLAFDGRLIARVGSDVVELKAGRSAGTMVSTPVAKDAGSPSVSPDRRWLLYSRGEKTILHDLRSGETKALLPHRSQSIIWSPDSSRFAYVRGKQTPGGCWEILVADLSGNTRHVHEDAPAPYVTTGGHWGAAKMPTPICGAISTEAWIAADRFLFSRYTGEWPMELQLPTMPADTTTLAVAGDPVTLEDWQGYWSIHDTCASQSIVLFYDRGEHHLGSIAAGARDPQPKRLPRDRRDSRASATDIIGFLPGDCRIYALAYDANGGIGGRKSDDRVITILDPRSLEPIRRASLGRTSVWQEPLFDREGRRMLIVETRSDATATDPRRLTLIDVTRRGNLMSRSVRLHEFAASANPQVLAWLESP